MATKQQIQKVNEALQVQIGIAQALLDGDTVEMRWNGTVLEIVAAPAMKRCASCNHDGLLQAQVCPSCNESYVRHDALARYESAKKARAR